ncbi:MAG: hypothetical protein IJU68_07460 [Bacteroidales bacterium]|nr:hypothetical protein [Bacteroidales bacterium]
MRFYKYFALALGAAALTVSCDKKVEIDLAPAYDSVIRTFTFTIADEDTKFGIDNAGKTAWEAGDQIFIHGRYLNEGKTVTLTAGDIIDDKTATITVDLTGVTTYDPDSYYADFPADALSSANNSIYYYGEFSNTNRPLMAGYLSGSSFIMRNLCSAISFSAVGDFDAYLFSGNNGEVVGYGYYQVKANSEEWNYKRSTDGPKTEITGAFKSGERNFAYFPNGVSFSEGFTIKFTKGGEIKKYVTTNKSFSLSRNDYLSLPTISAGDLHDYVAPLHVSSLSIESDSYDLYVSNGNKSANSYIVYPTGNSEKVFRFKSVQGNSNTKVVVSSVEVLWESYNDKTEASSIDVIDEVDYDSDYIYFKMPASPHAGNAVIAARNALGAISWSWHIWVPNSSISDISATDFCGASYIMDRNLGAIDATASAGDANPTSIGLYYQWGRKDPFPSNSAFSGSTPITVSGTQMVKHNGLVNTEYSISHPLDYVYVYSVDDGKWNEDDPTDLWENSGKTIYDPCPPGYRVPVRDESKPMWKQEDTDWDYSLSSRFIYNGTFVFPIAGYIDCWGASYSNVNARSHIWSATNRSATTAYCMYFRDDKSPKMYSSNFNKAKAGSVRCVVE